MPIVAWEYMAVPWRGLSRGKTALWQFVAERHDIATEGP